MNKKGQIQVASEMFHNAMGLFSFIVVSVFMSLFLFSFHQKAQLIDALNIPILGTAFDFMLNYPVLVDWLSVVIYGLFFIATLYALSKVETSTFLYVVSFIYVLFSAFGLIALGIILDAFVSAPQFTVVTSSMGFIPFYASNAVMFNILYGFMGLIVLHLPTE